MEDTTAGAVYVKLALTNLVEFMQDTENLSVVRASSKALDDLAKGVARVIDGGHVVYAEGSEALIAFSSLPAARAGAAAIEGMLAAPADPHKPETYCTAVVSVVEADPGESLVRSLDRLENGLRRDQMRQASVVPGVMTGREECGLEGVRPATTYGWVGDGLRPLSGHVANRLVEGRRWRSWRAQQLFGEPAESEAPIEDGEDRAARTVWDESFEGLARFAPPGPVAGKMCLLHVDGNRFGACRSGITSAEDLTALTVLVDDALRRSLEEALRHLWERAREAEALPFHILYWAGDEFGLVVPAAAGVATAEVILSTFSPSFTGALSVVEDGEQRARLIRAIGGETLTLAIGMVVCDSHEPIDRADRASRRLCESAKAETGVDLERVRSAGAGNVIAFAVVESGMIPDAPSGYRAWARSAMAVGEFRDLVEDVRMLKWAGFPTGRLHALAGLLPSRASDVDLGSAAWEILSRVDWGALAAAIEGGRDGLGPEVAEDWERRLAAMRPPDNKACGVGSPYLDPWLTRRELWDYVALDGGTD